MTEDRTILYFTATGNCLQVAKNIGGETLSIPQMIKENRFEFENETIGIVFPIYAHGLPKIVNAFLKKAKLKAEYIFAIGTYGSMCGATMYNLFKYGKNIGISFDYTNSLLMVDNYLPMFEMQKEKKKIKEKGTEVNLQKIVKDIHEKKCNETKAGLLTRGYSMLAQSFKWYLLSNKKAQDYTVSNQCTKCKVCEKVCPTQNIKVEETVEFSDKCEVCMSCIHNCPANAIHLKSERSSARFRNSAVTLKEIQDANCQLTPK